MRDIEQPSLFDDSPPGPTGPPIKPRRGTITARLFDLMIDGRWRTPGEINHLLGGNVSEITITAVLRSFREKKRGAYFVDRRRRGDQKKGLHEYRVLANTWMNGRSN